MGKSSLRHFPFLYPRDGDSRWQAMVAGCAPLSQRIQVTPSGCWSGTAEAKFAVAPRKGPHTSHVFQCISSGRPSHFMPRRLRMGLTTEAYDMTSTHHGSYAGCLQPTCTLSALPMTLSLSLLLSLCNSSIAKASRM
jgi:hypothetical protein